MQKKEYSMEIGGKPLIAQFTDLADQANGSVIVRYGNTAVLATATMGYEREGLGYFPLTVDYEEKFYAAGAILGSRFMRREGKPSDEAVLSGRVVDRTIRPLFEKHIRNDIQVIITILSIDEDDPGIPAVNAASLALAVSDIPWDGPVSAVRIGLHKESGVFEVNPTYAFREDAKAMLDLTVCGRNNTINMIEVGAREVDEDTLEKALLKASEEIEKIQEFQKGIVSEIGRTKQVFPKKEIGAELKALFTEHIETKLEEAVFESTNKGGINELKRTWLALVEGKLPEARQDADDYYETKIDELVHEKALNEDMRPDGRAMDAVRELYAQAGGVSPIIHGSGIFYRGATHVFSALTLGGPQDSLLIDSIESQDFHKRFMHHYNFPPFSAGETGRVGGFNRRQIGHGALAEKALFAVIPPKEVFPYTIRIVSESMASNGSTSMASVCASSLALMDAGVPITRPVAGIAMGLMMSPKHARDNQYKVLTDIQGPEDHHGDMDFKVAGTSEGVTAVQMDVKVDGIPIPILKEALLDAKKARLHILKVMEKEIGMARPEISPRAPKIVTLTVKKEQIGLVIGPGGKTINGMKEKTGVDEITIEEDGTIYITGKNGTADEAKKMIEALTHEYKAGERYEGEVVRVADFGAFVEIGPNTDGLVHVSEIAPFRIDRVSDVLKEGERVSVVVKEVDEQGRIKLSIKQADPDFASRKGIKPSSNIPGVRGDTSSRGNGGGFRGNNTRRR